MKKLYSTYITTPLGTMVALADEHALYAVKFADSYTPDVTLNLIERTTPPLIAVKKQLQNYFDGTLTQFALPLHFDGTLFQTNVWKALQTVSFGKTCSYAQLAYTIGQPSAHRAVANANGANQFTIIIPCHRVIKSDGTLGGYNGKIEHKKWLLQHEQRLTNS